MKKLSALLLIFIIMIFMGVSNNLNNIVPVNFTTIEEIEYNEYVSASGRFESSKKSNIILSYPVFVKKVLVEENQFVNSGQALFVLDIDKMLSALNGGLTGEIPDNISYSDISQLKTPRNIPDISQLSETVYASVSGTVTAVNIYPGNLIPQNTTLITISHSDNLLARFTVSQQDYGKISVGDTVEIAPVAYSDFTYSGEIINKNAVIKTQSGTTGKKVVVDVFAHIENPDSKIADGLQINGRIKNGPDKVIRALDYRFINQDDGGEFVYILKNGTAFKMYIETGIETEKHTELLTRLPEDTVFLSGEIKDGSRVILNE